MSGACAHETFWDTTPTGLRRCDDCGKVAPARAGHVAGARVYMTQLDAARADLARVTADQAVEFGVRWKIDDEEQPVSTFSTTERRSGFVDWLDSRGSRFVVVELVERQVTPWRAALDGSAGTGGAG